MNQKILKFIAKNHLLTLSVRDEDKGVYIANCYYALDKKDCCLLIKSALDSKHIKLAIQNPHLAVSIAKDSKKLILIKGVQIKALFKQAINEQKSLYYSQFPFARFASGEIFALEILWAKYTDNGLLISEKLIYQKEK
ncbi:hypothetical protein MKD52_01795 [Helicobacter sp. CaF467b]|uniref:hypothetical protein n=1 Tax=Helicobacter sp. CaF467b TaxID=2919923 RepID=UPI001F589887|nr:hypothetical protein [Helicobacter sp. CaF467b]MCI2235569.1 hypothetical protein [Helicobacter sp. CaF467b]